MNAVGVGRRRAARSRARSSRRSATARVFAASANSCRPASSTARSGLRQIGLVEIERRAAAAWPRGTESRAAAAASSPAAPASRSGCPASSAVRQRCRISCSFFSSALRRLLQVLSSRSSRRSTTPRSARMHLVLHRPRRRAPDRSEPAACGTDGSRNMRTTCSSASALRNGGDVEQGGGAAPCRPAPPMSANSTVAGHVLLRIEERGQLIEALVGDAGDADVGVLLAAGAGRLAGAGQQLEEGGFTRRGKANESGAEHDRSAASLARANGAKKRRKPKRLYILRVDRPGRPLLSRWNFVEQSGVNSRAPGQSRRQN